MGYFIKARLDKQSEKERRYFERKEERYKKLLTLMISLYRTQDREKLRDIKRTFLTEYDQSWLYASDEVIRLLSQFIESLTPDQFNTKTAMALVGKTVIQMRKDLGYKNTKLTEGNWGPREHE